MNGGRCWIRTSDLPDVTGALWPAELTVRGDNYIKDCYD